MDFILVILLIVIAVLVYRIYKRNMAREVIDAPHQGEKKPYTKNELRIENVEAGGVVRLKNVGPAMDEYDISILGRHLYRDEDGYEWWELEGDRGDAKVWIDLEEDDELEMALTLRKLKLRDLDLTPAELDRMDDVEKGSFMFEGEKFYYEESGNATFYRYGNISQPERLYYYDFENDNGDKFIGVEKWSDGSYEVFISSPIKPYQVEVYSLRKTEEL